MPGAGHGRMFRLPANHRPGAEEVNRRFLRQDLHLREKVTLHRPHRSPDFDPAEPLPIP